MSAPLVGHADTQCSELLNRPFSDTTLTRTEEVAAGAFIAPAEWRDMLKPWLSGLPAFCRVVGVIRPTTDSQIEFELWLPQTWNRRYLQVGNMGFAGGIAYTGLIQGLQNGFAVASTNDGHFGPETGWMQGHPQSLIDFGYRAVHFTSVVARQITGSYYGGSIPYSYFSGCSEGGREGLVEAQRYPEDFSGWLVGSPSNDWVRLMVFQLSKVQLASALKEPLTAAQLDNLTTATIESCDAADGVEDGVIEQPLRCTFDPQKLQCKGAPDGRCLSPQQVQLVRRIYAPVKSASGATLLPGLQGTRGVEASSWEFPRITGANTASPVTLYDQAVLGFWPKWVYGKDEFNYKNQDLADARAKGEARDGSLLDATRSDLSMIRASGKKIIQYHGWADSAVPAQHSIVYYETVEKTLGRPNGDFYRLFLAPSMMHCWAGPGPNIFGAAYAPGGLFDREHHALAALTEWVEKGLAPDRIVATKYQNDDPTKAAIRTRPLCPYPQIARWSGTGSTEDARNFVCSASQ